MIYNFYKKKKPTNVAVWTRRCRIAIHTYTYIHTIDLLTQEVLTHRRVIPALFFYLEGNKLISGSEESRRRV